MDSVSYLFQFLLPEFTWYGDGCPFIHILSLYFSFCCQSSRGMEMDALSSTFYLFISVSAARVHVVWRWMPFHPHSISLFQFLLPEFTWYGDGCPFIHILSLYFSFCCQSSRGMEMDALSSTFYLFISVSAARVHVVWRWMPFHPHSISWCKVQDYELQNLFTGTLTD